MKREIALAVFCLGTCLAVAAGKSVVKDMTSSMENLGIPLAGRYPDSAFGGFGAYARNVWALKAFDGRIYIGAGNSANTGPAMNAGPVPVVSFSPKTKRFETEWSVPDEQIDIFRTFGDGALYIPGHDPKEDWSLGNIYRRCADSSGDASWKKIRVLPNGIHCYDIAEFDGKQVACGNHLWVSPDTAENLALSRNDASGRRYSLLVFDNAIYAVGAATFAGKFTYEKGGRSIEVARATTCGIDRMGTGGEFSKVKDNGNVKSPSADTRHVFPDIEGDASREYSVRRPVSFNGRVVYIGGYEHFDHQILPFGAYSAVDGPTCFTAERIQLPKGAVPWNTLVVGKKALLLWSTKEGGAYVNHISFSSDGLAFKELFYFRAETFARSFEYLDGYFYFGLGTEVEVEKGYKASDFSPASGTILRCRF